MRPSGECYTTAGAVLELLAGVDLSELENALSALGTSLAAHIETRWVPFGAADVDAICKRDFLPHDDERTWLRGTGAPTLTLAATRRPLRSLAKATIYVTPATPWVTLDAVGYTNVHDEEGREIRPASTQDEYALAEVIVDCMLPQLTIPPSIHLLSRALATPYQTIAWLEAGNFPNIYLEYSYGYETPPTAIVQANTNFAAIRVLGVAGDLESKGLSSWSLGDESRSWGQQGAGNISQLLSPYTLGGPHSALGNQLLAAAREALGPYVAFGVAA